MALKSAASLGAPQPGWLTAHAYVQLIYVDLQRLRGFRVLRQLALEARTNAPVGNPDQIITAVTRAVETACLLYVRPVHCLQRALVVTRLLRRCGVASHVVIGCTMLPLQAHAWVEAEGDVVSNEVFGLEHYRVLDRW